ncbi:hypothetical protein FG384_19040 [Psychrobacillus vulpis]|uniref:Uncharacterized protein n=2 Tax=Psychrobacillus vulpis TaxID=2325572 RepID=A0A544TFI5_9BACI|nr:hypothetical protein FG384_19040 [Psychrobacillus vulpis]
MIQLYIQWCFNNNLNAVALYNQAYPQQETNIPLLNAVEEMENNHLEVDTETLLNVLQLFGNEDLALVVSQEAEKLAK